ncbi:MAG TPA: DUF3047 domain-containing protein [Myxococcota bacterium]|nr:DUF3047 domain-containing protein [Myxococcota bacterium]
MATGTGALAKRWEKFSAALPANLRAQVIAEARVLELPGDVPPWTDTGLRIAKDDEISVLAEGRIVISEAAGLSYRPRFALWARVAGRGPIWTGPRDTQSFRAERSGALELAIYNGEWRTPDGLLGTPVEAYAGVTGALEALVIRWRGEARAGLEELQRSAPGEPLVAAELERLASPSVRPTGWSYLWFLGQSDTYRALRADGRDSISCRCEDDVAILRRPVEFPLAPDTELRWRWKIDQLPSSAPEDTLLCHDYLSVAVEFENGRDLSWFWSASLAPETSFACPIPQWTPRETHLVVRSGTEGLHEWRSERRRVQTDYRAAIGDPPQRIVAVWLIANSVFQHGKGIAEFADISVEGGGKTLEVVGR